MQPPPTPWLTGRIALLMVAHAVILHVRRHRAPSATVGQLRREGFKAALPGPMWDSSRPTADERLSMDSLIALAESKLLSPGGIATGDLDRVFSQLMGPSIDAADLYFQHSRSESWVLEEGIVKDGSHSIEQGVGVRAMAGEKTGFAYSDEIVLPQLLEASRAARAIAHDGHGAGKPLALNGARQLYPAMDPVESLPNPDKIALLREVDARHWSTLNPSMPPPVG
jgi:TldD protein